MKKLALMTASAIAAFPALPTAAGERIEVIEHALTDATLDLGANESCAIADIVGDLLTFANPVYDASNKTQLGTDQGYCVRVIVGKSWECFWTLLLKGGQITVERPFYDSGDSLLVITGGSGQYAGAMGDMKLLARDAKGSSYVFVYELL